MPISTFAIILGVMAYALGFPLVFGDKDVVAWRKKLIKDEYMLRFLGVIFAILAVLVLKKQWNITWDADGLVVLLAWLTLAKAFLMAWWPDQVAVMRGPWEDKMLSTQTMQMVSGLLMVLAGCFMTYLGLVMI